MDDDQFVQRIVQKIERSTGRPVNVEIDHQDASKLDVELELEVPRVVIGANAIRYAGFARMCIEYATASIRKQRKIDILEFHLLLARN